MKIVDRQAFMALPAETLYSEYEPCYMGPLCIKGDTIVHDGEAIDWFYQGIADSLDCHDTGEFVNKLNDSQTNGTSIGMDFDTQGRDGWFKDDQLYAAWEIDDMQYLVNRLSRALAELQKRRQT